jgi:hypothetical protein
MVAGGGSGRRGLDLPTSHPSPMPGCHETLYLPGYEVFELLDLSVGLRVLLQVPICKEGLGRQRVTQCTCPFHIEFSTLGPGERSCV